MRLWQVVVISFLIGMLIAELWIHHLQVSVPAVQPLKVTILDDGGSHLKVESTVKEVK